MTEPQAAGSANHPPDAVATAPPSTSGEKTTAAPSSPEKSVAAAESPSNLSPEDAVSASGKGGASQGLAPQAGGATEISPAAPSYAGVQAMPKESATFPADATPSRSGPSSAASSETSAPAAAVDKRSRRDSPYGSGPLGSPTARFHRPIARCSGADGIATALWGRSRQGPTPSRRCAWRRIF